MGIEWYIAGAIVIAFIWLTITSMLNGMTVGMGRSRVLIRILYKSGNSQEIWFTSFIVTRGSDGALHGMEWDEYDTSRRPIAMGAVDDIEGIYKLEEIISIWGAFRQLIGKSWLHS